MRSVLTLVVFSTVVVLAAAGALVAGDQLHGRTGDDPHRDAMGRALEQVGVTADQRQQLEAAHQRHDEVADRLHALMAAAHERLSRVIHGEPFDEAAIRAAAADYAAPQADLFVAKGELFEDARLILTPDQLEQLEQMRDAHHGDHDLHGGSPHGSHGDLHEQGR